MGLSLSRRRIRRIMKRLNLVSVYQQASFKPYAKGKTKPYSKSLRQTVLPRKPLEVIVTDLTYVRVGQR